MSNFVVIWLFSQILNMVHKLKHVWIFQFQSWTWSNLSINLSNLKFLHVNLLLVVSKLSQCFVEFTSFSTYNSNVWIKCRVSKLKFDFVDLYNFLWVCDLLFCDLLFYFNLFFLLDYLDFLFVTIRLYFYSFQACNNF
jgi:hypothetical protein